MGFVGKVLKNVKHKQKCLYLLCSINKSVYLCIINLRVTQITLRFMPTNIIKFVGLTNKYVKICVLAENDVM